MNRLACNLARLKKEFARTYDGDSNIQEVIPASKSERFPVEDRHLQMLHLFASKNPIYYNSYRQDIDKTDCIIYEGDINRYWLSSITQDSSHAPFSPTWILSAFIVALQSKEMGGTEIVEIGSGDGRVAYCAKILGLEPYSIEIDDELVDLQSIISNDTGVDFNPICADVTGFDFCSLNLQHPVFFIGALAQMGGDILGSSIIEKTRMIKNSRFVLAGTYSSKYVHSQDQAGWADFIKKADLEIIKTVSLPTVWTFREQADTPFIFTKLQ